jgi:nucleoporin NUP42
LTNRTRIDSSAEKYNVTVDTIERDLINEVPHWILSAYAPGRDAPQQLFGGFPREQSFEELRLHYMMGKATGNEQQAVSNGQLDLMSEHRS